MKIFVLPKMLLCWYIFVFASTEFLSYFNLLSRQLVLPLDLIFLSLLVYYHRQELINLFKSLSFKSKFSLYFFMILLLTFIQGLMSAPSTTDSMVYHLPRIMYWIQEKTLYQDVIRNEHDFMAPFAEYILLHLYLLFGSDRFLFFSQWSAAVGSVVLFITIGKKYLNKKIQSATLAIFGISLPILLLQSASTQVDLVTTFLVLMSVYLAFSFTARPNISNSLGLGFAIGLGVLTKATFVIFLIIPLGIIILGLIKNNKNLQNKILLLSFASLISIVLQVRFINQNLTLYGNFSGQPILEQGSSYTNEAVTSPIIISNLLRNILINFPVPLFNIYIQSVLESTHKLIGLDINDPLNTYTLTSFKVSSVIYPQEDIVASPIHFLLILLAGIYLLFNIKTWKENPPLWSLYLLTLLSFVLFCAILKWQPFHPRLQIPFLMVGSLSSIVLLQRSKRLQGFLKVLIAATIVLSFLVVVLNISRPYISYTFFYNHVKSFSQPLASIPEPFYSKERTRQYFNPRFYWYTPYTQIINELKNEQQSLNISFNLMDSFEYPLWILLQDNNFKFKIIPYPKIEDKTIIISTTPAPFYKEGYQTKCFKTEIDYGFACLSKRVNYEQLH